MLISKVENNRMEEWLPSIPGYEANAFGFIRSSRLKRILSQRTDKKGYKRVTVNIGMKRTQRTVHRLCALAFLKPDPFKTQINHIDGDKQNNAIENLEWVSLMENVNHARFVLKHISGAKGEKHGSTPFTNEDVLKIRSLLKAGSSNMEMSQKYKVSKSAISAIKHRRSWKHI